MRPRLQIIRGLPGSGKSTLALKRYPNILRLETDFVYESGGCYKFSKDREAMATKWLKDAVESAMSCGMDIVCPSVYPKLSGRLETVLDSAFNWGYDVYIHTMPLDVNYGSLHNVPAEVLLSMRRGFESDEMLWDKLGGRYAYAHLENELRFGLMPGKDGMMKFM